MKIAIASDHAAIELKAELAQWLRDEGHEVDDLGPATADRVDYPDYGYKLATAVASGAADRGIALCGSGIGISIAVIATRPAAARWSASRCRRRSRASIMTPMCWPWVRA